MHVQRFALPDGRWHFQHGPMDIIIGADGDAESLQAAHTSAWLRFQTVLDELVQELSLLRTPVRGCCRLRGSIARRMWLACLPYSDRFITPMAAVAGAVAEELVGCYSGPGVTRAWINNGGDIALHLAPGQAIQIGLYADLGQLDDTQLKSGIEIDGQFRLTSSMPVRGVATSGWRGRSFSLGIADSVTVLAQTAASADAAATVIANAVNIDDPRIARRPACELKDDADLGDIPVTVGVAALESDLVQQALRAGRLQAQKLREQGLIWSAALVCQNQVATTDTSFLTATRARRSAGQAHLAMIA